MNLQNLIAVLQEARALVLKPENDFSWSGWENSSDALAELDGLLAKLGGGELPQHGSLTILFLPTGSLQELSLSSGWGDAFIDLSNKFDAAMLLAYATPISETCDCLVTAQKHLVEVIHFGLDAINAEVSILGCSRCGQLWLKYFYENEGFSSSGRWYLGAISNDQSTSINLENAKRTLEQLDWYFLGGSYYGGVVGQGSGNIYLPS